MRCDEITEEILVKYLKGNLSEKQAGEVKSHIDRCPKCRESLEEANWIYDGLQEFGDVLFSEHIDAERLVSYVETPQDLTVEERRIIENHLRTCHSCSEEKRILEISQKELRRSGIKESTETIYTRARFLDKIFAQLWRLVRRPAFAYILLLLLIYPAYLGLIKKDFLGLSEVVLTTKELILTDQIRGIAKEVPEVQVPQTEILRLRIPYPIDTTFSLKYEVTISDSTGKTIWRNEDWRQYDVVNGQPFWSFELNPSVLPSGLLEVSIRKYRPDGPITSPTTIYQFRLIN